MKLLTALTENSVVFQNPPSGFLLHQPLKSQMFTLMIRECLVPCWAHAWEAEWWGWGWILPDVRVKKLCWKPLNWWESPILSVDAPQRLH